MSKRETPLLVTLATYNSITDAYLAKSKLESMGIRCFIEDESIGVLYGSALGGISIKVSGHDFEDAYLILKEQERKRQNARVLKEMSEVFVCPTCGTLNEHGGNFSEQGFFEKILISLGLKKSRVTCKHCHSRFKKSQLLK